MELRIHDLIQINSVDVLISHTEKPDWIQTSIERAPFVVVRRAHFERDCIPVGIRGINRNERFAAFVKTGDIVEVFSPEQIVQARNWHQYDQGVFPYLEDIKQIMDSNALDWGLIGSVGFELVSYVSTVNEKSDIDIVIRYVSELTPLLSKKIIDELSQLPVSVDVQVEMVDISFSLEEYAHSKGRPIRLKTKNGPMLKRLHESIERDDILVNQ